MCLKLPSLPQHLRPQGLLFCFPHWTHLEKMVLSLLLVPASPALRLGSVFQPVEVLPGQTVPRLDLADPRGKPASRGPHQPCAPAFDLSASGISSWKSRPQPTSTPSPTCPRKSPAWCAHMALGDESPVPRPGQVSSAISPRGRLPPPPPHFPIRPLFHRRCLPSV